MWPPSNAMLILDCSFGIGLSWLSWRGVQQGLVVKPWILFQALNHMKSQKERSDGVGHGRLGDISFSFHAHGKEGLLPVSMYVRWCIKIRSTHVQNAISLSFPEILN